MAYLSDEASRCSMCGTADWEWAESKHAYAPIKHTCEGCNRKAAVRDADDPEGTYIHLVPQDVFIEHERRRYEQMRDRKK